MEEKLSFPVFLNPAKKPELFLALSTRKDENMKVFSNSGKDEKALINRKRFLNKLRLSEKNIISAISVHDDNVEIVTEKDSGNFIENTDGLITSVKNIYLSITVADCLPVIIFSAQHKVLALLHCGWKGLQKEIIRKALKKIKADFGVNPEDFCAAIGPGIGKCHFEVKEDLLDKFSSFQEAIIFKDGKKYIDLKSIAKKQLERSGVKTESIFVSPVCTYCRADKYFSFRKDGSIPVKAMMFIAGMKK